MKSIKENLEGMRSLIRDLQTENEKNTIVDVTGNANDLLEVSSSGELKQTRLFALMPENLSANGETFDICITSTNPHKEFPIFDKLLGKTINIKITIV